MSHVRPDGGGPVWQQRPKRKRRYGIPSERDAALADRAGRALEALIEGTQPVSARFGDETVDSPGAGAVAAP